MRSIASLALFAGLAVAATIPNENGWYVRRADEMHDEDLPIVDLQVTDERFGDKVFTGTAESIYNQMRGERPELFANDTEISVEEASLEKRQGTFNCGWYSNLNDRVGQFWFCQEGLDYLRRLGTSWCGVSAAPACARVSCSNSCGMFLCNKQGSHLQVHCQDIATDIKAIADACYSQNLGHVGGARDFSSHFIGLRRQAC